MQLPHFFQTLGNGKDGEAIAFTNDGLIYHASGNGTLDVENIFESIDPSDMSVTGIAISGDTTNYNEATALVHDSGDVLLVAQRGDPKLFSITTGGVLAEIGNMDPVSKGLAFDCGVEPEPEPPSGPIVIIPTMGQWGMIIATILLGFFAVIAIRRRIKS